MRKKGLGPLINKDTYVLILGSLPGDESIEKQQYYAKSNNDFWKLISQVIGEDITKLDYDSKIEKLQENHIGLWDVFRSSFREGSLDSKIQEEELNEFSELDSIAPSLKLICFNGQKAGKHCYLFEELGYETNILPSSSGANRRNSEQRILEWKKISEYIK